MFAHVYYMCFIRVREVSVHLLLFTMLLALYVCVLKEVLFVLFVLLVSLHIVGFLLTSATSLYMFLHDDIVFHG